eukprot:TRINITY_DN14670_c0_g1_i3.p2 TRINITY_DN14670_c0_g1~~TRINITY_DN14670_c0_g1_i3.p2  ORF type:complete len:240 (+),score=29.18 TRINITY_DN14670_c0_g1_i3:75-794(+)
MCIRDRYKYSIWLGCIICLLLNHLERMRKQKIEVLFRLDLESNSRAEVTKASLRSQLESGIKGLKISSCNFFEASNDLVRAEFSSNIASLLKAEESLKKMITFEEHKETNTILDSLLLRIRETIAAYNDKGKRKEILEVMGNLLNGFETDLLKINEQVAKLEHLQKGNDKTELKDKSSPESKKKISALESELLEVISQLRHQEHLYNQLSKDTVKIIEAKVNLEPVSYTHLTLPTICSV